MTIKVIRIQRPNVLNTIERERDWEWDGEEEAPGARLGEGGLASALCVPLEFGSIAVGQHFSALVVLTNSSTSPIGPLSLSVSLTIEPEAAVAGPRVIPPPDTPTPTPTRLLSLVTPPLSELSTWQQLITLDVREAGLHALSVRLTPDKESLTEGAPRVPPLRKVFRFRASPSLTFRHAVHALGGGAALLVEVRARNVSPMPLHLVSARFEAEHGLAAVASAPPYDGEIPSQGTVSLLFTLTPERPSDIGVLATCTQLGRMELRWCSPNGEPGRVVTQPLRRKVPPAQPVRVWIAEPPRRLTVGTAVRTAVTLTNVSSDELTNAHLVVGGADGVAGLDPVREEEAVGAVVALGETRRPLPTLGAGESTTEHLDLLPVRAGLAHAPSLSIQGRDGAIIASWPSLCHVRITGE